MTLTFESLREAMRENSQQPEGPARNARAERLLVEAERLGEPLAVVEALGHQLQAYNYSSEKAKMFVPFSRLLRMWDENPADFDAYETHTLHWVFKWVSSGMLDQPHIPLASIEKWLGEMEHRYRLAGHSERAVRQGEFRVARHVGDRVRAERAFAAWLAAERDRMADCHACELHGQGGWWAELGDDEQALRTWAPVLAGEHTCAHEPHAVLASSLLPLVRLGRADEARVNHLRGYRLVRPMESMRGAVADHLEFCALTGNEARGLEILAERPAYFTDGGDPDSQLDFLAVTALLMDRLVVLGLGGQPVPGPAREGGARWTAAELAAHARVEALAIGRRFDERNGTGRVSERARGRMDAEPLLDRLPLGVRAAGAVPVPMPVQAPPVEPRDLLAEARRLSAELNPAARGAWEAVASAVASGTVELDALGRAELDDHRAIAMAEGPAESVRLFLRAAEGYEAAGDPGEAEAARARAAYAQALADGPADATATATLENVITRVLALHAEGTATPRQVAGALLSRVRVGLLRLHAEDEGDEGSGRDGAPRAEVVAALDGLFAFAAACGDDPLVADRVAEAEAVRGDLAAHAGDTEGAVRQYAYAAELCHRAGLPWYAVEPEARLSRVALHIGDLEAAERAARAALDHGAEHAGAAGQTRLRLQLAEVLGAADRFGEASAHALEAAHWADEAGESLGIGAYARHQLGGWLLRESRVEEAAAILESVLPDLSVAEHGDGMVVQTLWWLGDCLAALNEPRSAAEQWLRAAELAKEWPDQRDHAMLANLAGQALLQAELRPEAAAAYERAGELWRELDDLPAYVRTLRVRAWISGAGGDGRALMDAAAEACGDDGVARGDTYVQAAELLGDGVDVDVALSYATRAVAEFAAAGPEFRDRRTAAELLAAWLHVRLEDGAAAGALARGVLAEYGTSEVGAAAERRAEAEAVLERVGS
ncbi:tetratricopeptide repeat protein [Streptomyces sp. P9(2023)]|uniref:tetratricopeptide repeat protein n=1 Tax=Streptomyces sp. P9(2023) TaxID=3064394 RepID=UPI0028F451BF|nr:tetratricopeptide repeat protein [Streptomyces sp. P9(2023)]MDT9692732.1 tetratricopeptide repeat protein [Streptomyces sp. P9(2023)]